MHNFVMFGLKKSVLKTQESLIQFIMPEALQRFRLFFHLDKGT
jgi:hypothetical protein